MLLGMPALVPVEARLHSARHEPDTYYEVIRDWKGGFFSSVDQRYNRTRTAISLEKWRTIMR